MEKAGKVITYPPEKSAEIFKRQNENRKKTNLEYKIMMNKTYSDPRIYKPLL